MSNAEIGVICLLILTVPIWLPLVLVYCVTWTVAFGICLIVYWPLYGLCWSLGWIIRSLFKLLKIT